MDWISRAISVSSCSRLGGLVADLIVAIDSFVTSMGPPGSAREIAIPATNGARRTLIHSSSVKSLLAVTMRAPLAESTPPIYPRMREPMPSLNRYVLNHGQDGIALSSWVSQAYSSPGEPPPRL
jgi:hypothetical protein